MTDHLDNDDNNSTSIPSFLLSDIRLATHHESTCLGQDGSLYYVPEFETFPCPSGFRGFIRRQCVYDDSSVHWTHNITHCVSDEHDQKENVLEWTYQIEGVQPRLARAMVEETTERISKLVSYQLHGHLSELKVIGIEEKCSLIDIKKKDILYYSKMNCIQYSIYTRVPSSYRLDLLSMVSSQGDVYCNALRQQFPDEMHSCVHIALKGDVLVSSIDRWRYYPVLMGSLVAIVALAMLIAYRKRIAAYMARARENKRAIQNVNMQLADRMVCPLLNVPQRPVPNGIVIETQKGKLYCVNVVTFNKV